MALLAVVMYFEFESILSMCVYILKISHKPKAEVEHELKKSVSFGPLFDETV